MLIEGVSCGSLEVFRDGDIQNDASGEYGSMITYTCNNGFELNGPSVRVCLSDGEWSGDAPSCAGKHSLTGTKSMGYVYM